MLRDRRTVITMIIMPILLMPAIISLTSYIASNQVKKAQEKDIRIGIHTNTYNINDSTTFNSNEAFFISCHFEDQENAELIYYGTKSSFNVIYDETGKTTTRKFKVFDIIKT